jgi:tripartite-type tricarboxylate transporter receptor subunit TctC
LFKDPNMTDNQHVPSMGASPAVTDHRRPPDVIFYNFPGGIAHVKSGRLRPWPSQAVGRHLMLPDVLTTSEAGAPHLPAAVTTGMADPYQRGGSFFRSAMCPRVTSM